MSSPDSIPLSSILEKRRNSLKSSGTKVEEQPLDPLDEPLPPWNLPKVRASDVFKPDNVLLHALGLQKNSNAEFVQGTSEITLNSEKIVDMPLMSPAKQCSYKNRGCQFVHLGMIQVGIAPSTRRSLNTSALACVLDCRLLDFQEALLTALQASVEEGPIYFAYYPNYDLSVSEIYLNQTLKMRVRTSDAHGPRDEREGDDRVKLRIAWRVCYRVTNRFILARKHSSSTFDGVYQQTSLDGKKTTTKTVDPAQVHIPKRWFEEQRTLIKPVSSSNSTSS